MCLIHSNASASSLIASNTSTSLVASITSSSLVASITSSSLVASMKVSMTVLISVGSSVVTVSGTTANGMLMLSKVMRSDSTSSSSDSESVEAFTISFFDTGATHANYASPRAIAICFSYVLMILLNDLIAIPSHIALSRFSNLMLFL